MAMILPRLSHAEGPVRPRTRRPSSRVIALLFAGAFLLLAADAMLNAHAFFDMWMIRAVQDIDASLVEGILRPVDTLTSGTGAVTMWGALLVVFVAARWWIPALGLASLPAGGVINHVVGEYLVERTRPGADQVQRVIGGTDAPSFPSGHVMGAVMLYGFLFVVADRITNTPARRMIKAASVIIIATIGPARVWYGAHWPTDVLAAYALGGMLLIPLVAVYRRLEASVGQLPLIRAAVPMHDESQPHAHALTSLVLFRGNSVAKVYAPGLLPRALFWAAFQAPFPYIRNLHALRAAMHRRNMVGMLTEYWYGSNRVARVTGIEPVGDGYALVSEYVDGHAPRDRAAAKCFLVDLRGRFEAAGLPTWQIDPRQPRAVDNVLETTDGRYTIVDLESGLVTPIASPKTWARAFRRGSVPMFDDVFFDITRTYVAREEGAMRATLGDSRVAELMEEVGAAEAATAAWVRSEPRLWSRLVRGVWNGFGARTWPARLRTRLNGSQDQAREWLGRAIAGWEAEGRITDAEAAELRMQMETPSFQAMIPHLGAHILISIPLRFPFGSIARAAWSFGALMTATARLVVQRGDRRAWGQAWSIHSPLVILLSTVPGFGTFAYLAAKPIRANHLLLRAATDAALVKAPWRLYERTGLRGMVARPAAFVSDPAAILTPDGPAAPATLLSPELVAAVSRPEAETRGSSRAPAETMPVFARTRSRPAEGATRLHYR